MKKKNGFTMVELLVSLVLITTLSIALFKVVANIQKKEQMNIARNSLTAFKAVLNNNIETDFINDTITELYSCGDNCFDMILTVFEHLPILFSSLKFDFE